MKTLTLKLGLLCALICTAEFSVAAQATAAPKPPPQKKVEIIVPSEPTVQQPTEKAIETVAKPSISLCAAARTVTVRGWQRAEVRALVENRKINFKVMERGEGDKPAWVIIQNAEAAGKNGQYDECFSGESVEIEVPTGARVTIKSRDSNILIDRVAKVMIKNANGDVTLRNISDEITVSNYSGNVAAEDSMGRISLASYDGDIAAFRLRPNEFGDQLSLSSTGGGKVVLRDVLHKNIEAKSLSGEIAVIGSLARGGNYDFATHSGSLLLQLPADFPFAIKATMTAGGNFQTDFPIKPVMQNQPGQARSMICTNGAGDTTINITTFSGLLRLKKK